MTDGSQLGRFAPIGGRIGLAIGSFAVALLLAECTLRLFVGEEDGKPFEFVGSPSWHELHVLDPHEALMTGGTAVELER